jgi:hypothetical protein
VCESERARGRQGGRERNKERVPVIWTLSGCERKRERERERESETV